MNKMNSLKLLASACATLGLLYGCASAGVLKINKDIRLVHGTVLRADMQKMAVSLGEISALHFDQSVSSESKYMKVSEELESIERIDSSLGGNDVITNYSVINQYMGSFLYDVTIAKQFLEKNPPNYFPAHELIRSCRACHLSM